MAAVGMVYTRSDRLPGRHSFIHSLTPISLLTPECQRIRYTIANGKTQQSSTNNKITTQHYLEIIVNYLYYTVAPVVQTGSYEEHGQDPGGCD